MAIQLALRLDLSGPSNEVMRAVESLTEGGLVVEGSAAGVGTRSVQMTTAEPTTAVHLAAIAAAVAGQQ